MPPKPDPSRSPVCRPAALVVRPLQRRWRWLAGLRRGYYRLRLRAGRAPLWFSLTAVSLTLLAAALTVQITWGYFGAVSAYDSYISIGQVNPGVTLRASLTCNAFEPAARVSAVSTAEDNPARLWVETCVENRGKEPTEGLRLLAVLQVYREDGSLEEVDHFPANLDGQPELDPGQKHCYSYPFQVDFDPRRTYRTEARVTVTNYRGVQCEDGQTCREGVTAAADFRVPGDAPTPAPMETETGIPLPTVTPTLTPEWTETLSPGPTITGIPSTETPFPEPTITFTPTIETPLPQPTSTGTPPADPSPTATAGPSLEPSSTPTPALETTGTPLPTLVPDPTDPPPTLAPEPTETPPPTLTPAPTDPPPENTASSG